LNRRIRPGQPPLPRDNDSGIRDRSFESSEHWLDDDEMKELILRTTTEESSVLSFD
jgi:hypothetical protein